MRHLYILPLMHLDGQRESCARREAVSVAKCKLREAPFRKWWSDKKKTLNNFYGVSRTTINVLPEDTRTNQDTFGFNNHHFHGTWPASIFEPDRSPIKKRNKQKLTVTKIGARSCVLLYVQVSYVSSLPLILPLIDQLKKKFILAVL